MSFTSLPFFVFLPAVYLIFYLTGERYRWAVLLAASLLFYAAPVTPYLPAVLLLSALTTYCCGILLEKASSPSAKSAVFWSGVVANLLILAVMKYLPFLAETIDVVASPISLPVQFPAVGTFISIGVSYYILQTISYLTDIHLGLEKPERHFGHFALYLAFFPKLLLGPIERAGDLLPQLKKSYRFDYDNMRFGLLQFTWGLFKKVAVADRIGLFVDTVYNDPHSFTGLPLLLATYAYALQIYLDFSGYTDMALGCARLFNINLTRNFNSPYLATSVADFWRRWHISFSRWLLDYVFRPLQMRWRDRKTGGTAAALVITFLVSGLWHGASWGFVIWGGLHGLFLACSVVCRPYRKKLHGLLGIGDSRSMRIWQMFATFHLVSFAWIFFRANSVKDACHIALNILDFSGFTDSFPRLFGSATFVYDIVMTAGSLLVVLLVTMLASRVGLSTRPTWFRWAVYFSLIFLTFIFQAPDSSDFLYVRF